MGMLRKRGKTVALVAATALVSSGAFASAQALRTTADARTVIHGCYNETNGALRIDRTCKEQRRVDFVEQRGSRGAQRPVGATGAQGAPGPKGDKGDTGETGATGAKGDKGDTGETGAKGDKGDKGDPGLAWRGTWSPTELYGPGDVVHYARDAYVATALTTMTEPDGPLAPWQVLARGGMTGAQGPQGETAPQALRAPPVLRALPALRAPPARRARPARRGLPEAGGTASLTSPNGLYSIRITDRGIVLSGPGGTIHIGPYGVRGPW